MKTRTGLMRGEGMGLMMNGLLSSLLFRFRNDFRFLLDRMEDLNDPCTQEKLGKLG
jgi:hypothetical protein